MFVDFWKENWIFYFLKLSVFYKCFYFEIYLLIFFLKDLKIWVWVFKGICIVEYVNCKILDRVNFEVKIGFGYWVYDMF